MTSEQKAQLTMELTLAVQQLAFAGVREDDPAATDEEIWLRLAARRLGTDIVQKAYGVQPKLK